MESALYSIWVINLRNLARNKLHICREWHIQPSEIDKLPYYQYEDYLELIQEHNKEEEKRRKEAEEGIDPEEGTDPEEGIDPEEWADNLLYLFYLFYLNLYYQ